MTIKHSWQEIRNAHETDYRLMEEKIQTLPTSERPHYQHWWAAYQEMMTWDEYKENGFAEFRHPTNREVHAEFVKNNQKNTKTGYMPTGMARTSPFFPMKKGDDRPIHDNLVIENKWGRLIISGPRLSILDETVLLALIRLDTQRRNGSSQEFLTDLSELCALCGTGRGTGSFKAIQESLERMTRVVARKDSYNIENDSKKIVDISTGAFISHFRLAPEKGKIIIALNPYFTDQHSRNLSTSVDLEERAKQKGDVAKAIHRFLETHKNNKFPYHVITLCRAVNINTELSLSAIRRTLRIALDELRTNGIVTNWKRDKNDLYFIQK